MSTLSNSRETQRACDSCRARKVRCDRRSPCSNCKSTSTVCRTTKTQDKEQRSRVIISKEYEKKIDRIGDRLGNIEELLKRIPNLASGTGTILRTDGDASDYADGEPTSPSDSQSDGQVDDENTFDGDVTANAHSALANRIFEQAVDKSPIVYRVPELTDALSSLREMISKIKDDSSRAEFRYHRLTPKVYAKAPLPSLAETYELLEKADSSLTFAFTPTLRVEWLREKCESLINHPGESTDSRRLLVCGMMYSLCIEYSGLSEEKDESARYMDLAQRFLAHFEVALGELRMIIPATRENVEALTVAASCSMDLCRPHLAWKLSTQAASMSQVLGYHRIATMRSDSEDERNRKVFFFWIIYTLERGFSIRLGRSSTIQDHDITVPLPPYITGFPREFSDIMRYWVEVSRVQGVAVQQLYSPAALLDTREERQRRASVLYSTLDREWHRRRSLPTSKESSKVFYFSRLLLDSDSIMHYSTLALIQHATSSSHFVKSPALDTSRVALRLTIETREAHNGLHEYMWAVHCHWVLLHCPFTPYTVLFTHIIANPLSTASDLQLLEMFVGSLQSLAHISNGVAKLARLCGVFWKVAQLYVQAKKQEAETQAAPTAIESMGVEGGNGNEMDLQSEMISSSDIDDYLAAIGFAPPAQQQQQQQQQMEFVGSGNFMSAAGGEEQQDVGLSGDATTMGNDATYLNDWLCGNSSLLGLLEQDLSLPNDSLGGDGGASASGIS